MNPQEYEIAQWVSVSERLPEAGEPVLVCKGFEVSNEDFFAVAFHSYSKHLERDAWYCMDSLLEGVKFWRPIPLGPNSIPKRHPMGPEVLATKLRSWANNMFARYGFPVYLVGSSLRGGGRDVDIRIIIPYHDYYARWPDGHGSGDWALEMGKQGRIAALYARANVDFQVQNDVEAVAYKDDPRLRLDSATFPEAEEPPKAGIGLG